MSNLPFLPDTTVPEALSAAPGVPKVFNDHRTACVGCSLARFCTLRDVARTYDLDLDKFQAELKRAQAFDPFNTTGEPDEKSD